jgi:hypothetical protein
MCEIVNTNASDFLKSNIYRMFPKKFIAGAKLISICGQILGSCHMLGSVRDQVLGVYVYCCSIVALFY